MSSPIWNIISQLADIFAAYEEVHIRDFLTTPSVSVIDEDDNTLTITQTFDSHLDVYVVHFIDGNELHASYRIGIMDDIVITKINGEQLEYPRVIAQYDAVNGMFVDNTIEDDAYFILCAHQDLFETLLSIS